MTPDHITLFTILAATLVLFVWGRLRFDMVAMLALFACVLAGLVEPAESFEGFSHPAVITVIAVLAISRALAHSGLIDLLSARLTQRVTRPFSQRAALCGIAAVLSAFMNNVGALALLMPVALSTAHKSGYSSARLLMPLAFASILGGLITLIGTPPNILISTYRRSAGSEPFGMFDFTPVGLVLALAGTAFVVLVGYRLIPGERQGRPPPEKLFEVSDYLTEVRVSEKSDAVGKTITEFEKSVEGDVGVLGLVRDERRIMGRLRLERLQPGDILLVRGASGALKDLLREAGLELVASEALREELASGDLGLMEAVIMPRAWIEGRTPAELHLRSRYGLALLAVAREGRPISRRLRDVRLSPGDVLLVQGETETLTEALGHLGCLPLASRGLKFQPRRALLPVLIFAAALTGAVWGLPTALSLLGALGVMILVGLLPADEAYDAVDWPVVVLLGAMIPVGGALETSGATILVADTITALAGDVSPLLVLAALLVITMTLSDIMNNAATAVVMAPITIAIAQRLGVNPDAFLMAVAVGASSAFLTPIGHQNNTLIMGPGGYRFGDFWRVGLPLECLLVAIAVPLIPLVWPL